MEKKTKQKNNSIPSKHPQSVIIAIKNNRNENIQNIAYLKKYNFILHSKCI